MFQRVYLQHFIVLMLFALLTIWYSWPLVQYIDHGFISETKGSDAVQYIWNAWAFKTNLAEGNSVLYSDKVLVPEGANLIMHASTPIMSMFCLMFENRYWGMNIFLLLNFLLSAFGAYLLGWYLTGNRPASLLTGLVFGFSAYKLLHFPQHYNLLLTAPIPFYVYGFLKSFSFVPGKFIPAIVNWRFFIFTLICGLLAGLSDYYAVFYLLYFSFFWAFYNAFAPIWSKFSLLKKWGVVALLITSIHLLIDALRQGKVDDKGGIWWGGDMLSFFMPNSNTWLWNADWFGRMLPHIKKVSGNMELEMFQGFAVSLLCIGLLSSVVRGNLDPKIKPWAFILFIFLMICMPALVINGYKIIYLPTGILHYVPFLNNIRVPTRIQVMISLLLPLCGSWAILSMYRIPYRQSIIWLVLLVTLFELQPKSYPILSTQDVPQIIQTIKSSNANTLLTMPVGVRDGMLEIGKIELNDLYFQTIHGKAILGGEISRIPPKTFDRYLNDPVCKQLLALSADPNEKSTDPDKPMIDTFFQTFHPDAILIEPAYRGTQAERYIETLLKDRVYKNAEQDGWRLLTLRKE